MGLWGNGGGYLIENIAPGEEKNAGIRKKEARKRSIKK